MAKVTSKLQVTIPKHIADAHGIAPGDEIEFSRTAGGLRVDLVDQRAALPGVSERLALFDAATRRQQGREKGVKPKTSKSRGWSRADLYTRGRSR